MGSGAEPVIDFEQIRNNSTYIANPSTGSHSSPKRGTPSSAAGVCVCGMWTFLLLPEPRQNQQQSDGHMDVIKPRSRSWALAN
jgi:hypothetical protein